MQLDEIQAGGGGAGGALARVGLSVLALGWGAAWLGRRALYATGLKARKRECTETTMTGRIRTAGRAGRTNSSHDLTRTIAGRQKLPHALQVNAVSVFWQLLGNVACHSTFR